MSKSILLCVAAAALSACSSAPQSNGGSVHEVVFSSPSTKTLLGYEPTVVKVVAPADLSKAISLIQDRSGVPCVLKGENYSASFNAPATVLLPDYGRASSPVSVTCVYQNVTRTQTVSAFDATAANAGASVANSDGSLGAALAGALVDSVVSIDRRGRNDWKYPVIQVSYNSLAKN